MSDGVSARTIILGNRAPGTCMSSYRCHRPGNASDRASDEDILVSSGRLGWKWFRLGTASDRARMKTQRARTEIELG